MTNGRLYHKLKREEEDCFNELENEYGDDSYDSSLLDERCARKPAYEKLMKFYEDQKISTGIGEFFDIRRLNAARNNVAHAGLLDLKPEQIPSKILEDRDALCTESPEDATDVIRLRSVLRRILSSSLDIHTR